MADIPTLEAALRKAHAKAQAGDQEAAAHARRFAAEIRRMQAKPAMTPRPGGGYAMSSLDNEQSWLGDMFDAAIDGGNSLVSGVKDLYYKATGNQEGQDAVRAERDFVSAATASGRRKHPFTYGMTKGLVETAPAMGVMGGGSLAGAAGRGLLAGAIPGAVAYGNTGDTKERGFNGLLGGAGGAAGGAAGYGLAKLLTPGGVKGAADGMSDTALEAANRMGYRPLAGQMTKNPALLNKEQILARSPGSAPIMARRYDNNQAAINRTALSAIGQKGDRLDEGVLGVAKDQMGKAYDDINNSARPQLDSDTFIDAIARIDSANKDLGAFENPRIRGLVDKALDQASRGEMSGAAYQALRSELGRQAKSPTMNNSVKKGLKDLQKALDDAAAESLGTTKAALRSNLDRQYGDWKILSAPKVVEDGDVSAARVASQIGRKHGDGLLTGRANTELLDIARVGRGVGEVANPNSGQLAAAQARQDHPIRTLLTAPINAARAKAHLSPAMERYLRLQGLTEREIDLLVKSGTGAGLLGSSAIKGN